MPSPRALQARASCLEEHLASNMLLSGARDLLPAYALD